MMLRFRHRTLSPKQESGAFGSLQGASNPGNLLISWVRTSHAFMENKQSTVYVDK